MAVMFLRERVIERRLTYLQLLQVGSLHADYGRQQLVLQPVPCHREVDQRTLSLELWLVVRVCQLGVKDQTETGVVLALLIADLYVAVADYKPESSHYFMTQSICVCRFKFQSVSLEMVLLRPPNFSFISIYILKVCSYILRTDLCNILLLKTRWKCICFQSIDSIFWFRE